MESNLQHLVTLRQWLHTHPEISGEEKNTAAHLVGLLQSLNPDFIKEKIGGEGILVLFDSGKPGPVLLFRSELDALPIQETNDFAHRSLANGISHKCGHDGHATILYGLAEKLARQWPLSGKVYLLFQPAEETGEGAERVVADSIFRNIKPDYVFALHNLPGYETGAIVIKEGLFSAAVNSIVIKLKGKTAHAAEPEMGINPAAAISQVIIAAEKLSNNNPGKETFRVVTPVHISLGSIAYGTSAGYGELHYTLRCWNNEELRKLENELLRECKSIALQFNLEMSYAFTQSFYANNNDNEAVNMIRQAANELGYKTEEKTVPFKWGEDFGFFTSAYKGAMFGLGAGLNHPALHNPDYDFPDEIIERGITIFHRIIFNLLNK